MSIALTPVRFVAVVPRPVAQRPAGAQLMFLNFAPGVGSIAPCPRATFDAASQRLFARLEVENQKRDVQALGQPAEFLALLTLEKRRVDDDRESRAEDLLRQFCQPRIGLRGRIGRIQVLPDATAKT